MVEARVAGPAPPTPRPAGIGGSVCSTPAATSWSGGAPAPEVGGEGASRTRALDGCRREFVLQVRERPGAAHPVIGRTFAGLFTCARARRRGVRVRPTASRSADLPFLRQEQGREGVAEFRDPLRDRESDVGVRALDGELPRLAKQPQSTRERKFLSSDVEGVRRIGHAFPVDRDAGFGHRARSRLRGADLVDTGAKRANSRVLRQQPVDGLFFGQRGHRSTGPVTWAGAGTARTTRPLPHTGGSRDA